MEAAAQAFYYMMDSAQKPLHGQTKVSQLDAIGRIMVLKSQYSLSRDAFDDMLTVIGSLLPEGHLLPRACTSHRNSFVHLRCRMSRYMLARRGASYLGKNTWKQSTV